MENHQASDRKTDKAKLYARCCQIMFVITVVSIATSVLLALSFDLVESFTKDLSIIISCVLFAAFWIMCFYFQRICITKKACYCALAIVLLCFVGVKCICHFTIEKWQNHPNLRPLMAQELERATTKYSLSVNNIKKETHPNFLEFYRRDEIRKMFYSPKNAEGKEHVTVILDVFEGTCDYDVYFAYTDYDGTDFWMVATYCKWTDKDTDFTHLNSIRVVPDGTTIDHTPKYT